MTIDPCIALAIKYIDQHLDAGQYINSHRSAQAAANCSREREAA